MHTASTGMRKLWCWRS